MMQAVPNSLQYMNFAEVDTDFLMIATIQAAQGVTDRLHSVLDEAII